MWVPVIIPVIIVFVVMDAFDGPQWKKDARRDHVTVFSKVGDADEEEDDE